MKKSVAVSFQDICDQDIRKAKRSNFADGVREGFFLALNAITQYCDMNFGDFMLGKRDAPVTDEKYLVSSINRAQAEWEKNIGSHL